MTDGHANPTIEERNDSDLDVTSLGSEHLGLAQGVLGKLLPCTVAARQN
jgi:hypothetical protein